MTTDMFYYKFLYFLLIWVRATVVGLKVLPAEAAKHITLRGCDHGTLKGSYMNLDLIRFFILIGSQPYFLSP